ncbi:phytanoyl-CoA dioxygenase family protein [Tenggerimyces flavus]|uniref:Phytanoyl-CoA dioxygenase family protein n=1 Tax=Tenggerimyces flavus TaxID=1708749 RepID=A0ABV7YPR1_9ACTN|nr:phytanoyl-CoA dioxygenase family protein [Tenggerimyces flavus]MBM7790131.1 ectoine hydroxylase-related dioxygenase (phytanoyl-CoA dioxygenase family) [Tenggerimyces flavus]
MENSDILAALNADGYCLVRNVLSDQQVAALGRRLDEQAAGEQIRRVEPPHADPDRLVPEFTLDGSIVEVDGTGFEIGGTDDQRVSNLVNKGAVFRELASHPFVDSIAPAMIGSPYLLSFLGANISRTERSAQAIHNDQRYLPESMADRCWCLTLLWMLDDFTEQNGATRLISGSHEWNEDDLARRGALETIPAIGPAGSVLVMDSRLLHGAGANRTDRPRRVIGATYVPYFVRQVENFSLQVSPEALAAASPRLRELLGFRVQSLLGGVEGHFGVPTIKAGAEGEIESQPAVGFFVERPRSTTPPLAADGRELDRST